MNPDDAPGVESCCVCGQAATGGASFSHLYHGGRKFPLCCPVCVQMFQRAPDRFARGEHPQTVVEDLLNEMKWKDSGRW